MRYFGTVKSFDETRGHGSIYPDHWHEEIGFERSAAMWRRSADPTPGQRFSYEVEKRAGRRRARNLRTITPSHANALALAPGGTGAKFGVNQHPLAADGPFYVSSEEIRS